MGVQVKAWKGAWWLFVNRARVEVDIFSREELTRLLVTAAQEMPKAYPLVLTLACTGLRIGEALTLQPHDLDLHQHHGRHVRASHPRHE